MGHQYRVDYTPEVAEGEEAVEQTVLIESDDYLDQDVLDKLTRQLCKGQAADKLVGKISGLQIVQPPAEGEGKSVELVTIPAEEYKMLLDALEELKSLKLAIGDEDPGPAIEPGPGEK